MRYAREYGGDVGVDTGDGTIQVGSQVGNDCSFGMGFLVEVSASAPLIEINTIGELTNQPLLVSFLGVISGIYPGQRLGAVKG